MIPINQDSAGSMLSNISKKVYEFPGNILSLKDNTIEALDAIGNFCKMIMKVLDQIYTVIVNPIIVLTLIDKLSIVVIIVLILLKMLGFHDLEKWIVLSILVKVITMIFI